MIWQLRWNSCQGQALQYTDSLSFVRVISIESVSKIKISYDYVSEGTSTHHTAKHTHNICVKSLLEFIVNVSLWIDLACVLNQQLLLILNHIESLTLFISSSILFEYSLARSAICLTFRHVYSET